MRRKRRPAYMLTQILCLLPLIVVAAAFTTQLAGNGILAQRLAMTNSSNDSETHRMLRVLQEDAGRATGATVEIDDEGTRLILESPTQPVVYRVVKKDLATTVTVFDGDAERSRFRFHRADLAFSIEQVNDREAVAWARFTFEHKWSERVVRTHALAGAARLGKGAAQ